VNTLNNIISNIICIISNILYVLCIYDFFLLAVLGFVLRASDLQVKGWCTWATVPSLFGVEYFWDNCLDYLPGRVSKPDPPDLCFLTCQDYRHVYWCPAYMFIFFKHLIFITNKEICSSMKILIVPGSSDCRGLVNHFNMPIYLIILKIVCINVITI
jgi:hypothetical protein